MSQEGEWTVSVMLAHFLTAGEKFTYSETAGYIPDRVDWVPVIYQWVSEWVKVIKAKLMRLGVWELRVSCCCRRHVPACGRCKVSLAREVVVMQSVVVVVLGQFRCCAVACIGQEVATQSLCLGVFGVEGMRHRCREQEMPDMVVPQRPPPTPAESAESFRKSNKHILKTFATWPAWDPFEAPWPKDTTCRWFSPSVFWQMPFEVSDNVTDCADHSMCFWISWRGVQGRGGG